MKKLIYLMFFLVLTSSLFAVQKGQGLGDSFPRDIVVGSSITATNTITGGEVTNNNFACVMIFSSYNVVAQSFTTSYSTMTGTRSSDNVVNFTIGVDTHTVTVQKAGLYEVDFSASVSGGNGEDTHGGISNNGLVQDQLETNFTTTGNTNYDGVAISGMIRLAIGDVVCTQWKALTGTTAPIFRFSRLFLKRISA